MRILRPTWVALFVFVLVTTAAVPVRAQGAAGPTARVAVAVANVRAGPGTTYAILAKARLGATYAITGRNQAGDWLQVCCVGEQRGWIYRPLLVVQGDLAGVPVVAPAPPATPAPTAPAGWRGEYFANRDLGGAPTFVRDDPEINFRWGGGSPGGGLSGSNFSVRWTRTATFEGGDYTFVAQVDDGVRVYLDSVLVIDQWRVGGMRTLVNTFKALSAGSHRVTVEYFQATGDAAVIVWWERASDFAQWKAEYFNDIYLQGPPLLVRNDPKIDFNWGLGSPDPRVPADNFSVRWTRRMYFEGGHYDFNATTSDGVRIYLDGLKVLDQWKDTVGFPTYTARFYELGPGYHTIVVEYYERGGIAYAMVYWNPVGGAPAPQ